MTGNTNVVLWNPARTSLPVAPGFSRPLAEPTLRSIRHSHRPTGTRLPDYLTLAAMADLLVPGVQLVR